MANVNLSQRDIDYIARVVDTEVPRSIQRSNPQEYRRMVNAVVDTVTNRMASGKYPTQAADVLNQSRQFSKITGPSFLNPYGSVQQTPRAPAEVRNIVADRIAGAAAGEPSEIGGALNYANPNFSSKSSLRGWIDPMINAGAQAFGIGKNVHYHGTPPGQQPAGPYTVTAEGIPNGRIPAPSLLEEQPQRPSSSPFDAILTPAAYQPSFPATPAPVQREALPDAMPTLADTSRFGPSPKMGRVPAAAPGPFDDGRFQTGAVTTTPQQLQRGLLDQQLDAGELPGLLGPATAWPGNAPITTSATSPAYVDPRVTTEQPSIKTAAVQPPADIPAAVPGMTGPAVQHQGLLGGPLQQSTPAEFQAYVDRTQHAMNRQNLLGGLGGGLLGGLVLGPIGAIAGGLLGKTIAQRNFFPEAPPTNPNNNQQKTGYAALDSSGRRSYSESKQFRDAVDGKMSPGLW
ncbi:cell wall hydrolase SleB-like protein [Rhizobium phage RHph_N3_2]|nr:cell wall hydrolase SleB-like protein [Rhizobium phage RHph_N3_2]